jgi:hypothetical protein
MAFFRSLFFRSCGETMLTVAPAVVLHRTSIRQIFSGFKVNPNDRNSG